MAERRFASLAKRQPSGVTIIEVVVAAGVFAMLAIAFGSVFLSASRLQQRSLRDARIIDNARYAMDSIGRTLRTIPSSSITNPTGNSPSQGFQPTRSNPLTINHEGRIGGFGCPSAPCAISYFLDGGTIWEQDGTASALPLTSSAVEITDFRVFINGRVAGDATQPRVTIVLRVRDRNDPPTATPFSLQTTVSLRPIDVE